MADDKIILFPENRIVNREKVDKENQKAVREQVRQQQTHEFVEGNVDIIARYLLSQFVEMGIKTQKPLFTQDLALLIDCLRGLIYRDFKMEHPAQKLSTQMVTLKKNGLGQITAKLDYKSVLNDNITTEPLSEDTVDEIDEINSPIDFQPDFDPSNDD